MSEMSPREAADVMEADVLVAPLSVHEPLRVLIDHARAAAPEDAVQAEVRRRMYVVAASWRISPPTPADARIPRDQEERHLTWRQVAEDVEAWADAADHLVPDLAPSVAAPPRGDEDETVRKLRGALARWKADVASAEDRALLMEAAETYVECLPAILAMPESTPAASVRDPEGPR